jgi:hypothetical protein
VLCDDIKMEMTNPYATEYPRTTVSRTAQNLQVQGASIIDLNAQSPKPIQHFEWLHFKVVRTESIT